MTIQELVEDIESELFVLEDNEFDDTKMFIHRLKYNLAEIKKICEKEEKEEKQMIEDLHLRHHGYSSKECRFCNNVAE